MVLGGQVRVLGGPPQGFPRLHAPWKMIKEKQIYKKKRQKEI